MSPNLNDLKSLRIKREFALNENLIKFIIDSMPEFQPILEFDGSDDTTGDNCDQIDGNVVSVGPNVNNNNNNNNNINKKKTNNSKKTNNGFKISEALVRKQAPTFLIIESLIWNICGFYQTNRDQQKNLFLQICERLEKYKIIGTSYKSESLQPNRDFIVSKLRELVASFVPNVKLNDNVFMPSCGLNTNTNAILNTTHLINHSSRFKEEFIDLGIIEEGGFGVVHKAKHRFDDCEYAVKMIRFRFKSDTDFKKITREVQLYANLSSHPNVVAYKTAWLENWCLHQQKLPLSEQMGSQSQEILSETQVSSKTSNINEDDVSIRFEESSKSGLRIERSITKISQTDYYSVSTKRIDIEEISDEEDIEEENEVSCNSDPGYSAFLRSSDDPMSARQTKMFGRKKTISISSTKSQSDSALEYSHCFEVEKYQKPVIPEINVTNFDSNRCPFACNSFGAVLYIQMELCGTNLKTWLRERNDQIFANYNKSCQTVSSTDDILSCIDSKMSLNIFRMVLKGVEFIHSQHLIHRDLKPQNILFSTDQIKIKIGDFGLATLHNSIDNEEISLHNYKQSTKTEAHNHTGGIGTSIYAAPEQKVGKIYDNRADLYSLGIILFELFYPLSTDMEKNKCVTHITKNRMLPENFQNRWPIVAEMILKLTDSQPLSRPLASDILQSSLFLGKEQQMIKSLEEKLHLVQSESERKDKELDALRTLLMTREQEIENLKLQLELMSNKKYKHTIR